MNVSCRLIKCQSLIPLTAWLSKHGDDDDDDDATVMMMTGDRRI